MTDLELKKAVESELNFEPSINAAEIGVAAKDGIITLSGSVPAIGKRWLRSARLHAFPG